MDTNKGLAKHEEMLPGRWTGSMRWTGFPCRGGGEGGRRRRGGESTNTLGVKIGKISDSLVL